MAAYQLFFFFFLSSRSISSIRGELVPYLVRKQFSKTINSQKIKDDTEDQSQKMSDGSTNHGYSSHRTVTASHSNIFSKACGISQQHFCIVSSSPFPYLFTAQSFLSRPVTSPFSSWPRSAPVGTTTTVTWVKPTMEESCAAMFTLWTRACATVLTL